MTPARILVVEDHPDVAGMLADFLTNDGHEVGVAGTLADARAQIGLGWDVIIVDLTLPDGDGVEVSGLAAGQNPAPKLIAMTGRSTSDDIAATERAGFYSHLVKPISLHRLRAVIEAVAGGG